MKILKHTLVFILALVVETSGASTGQNEKLDLSGLISISLDEETPVQDFAIRGKKMKAVQQLDLTGLDSIGEVEEQPVGDVVFTDEEQGRYRTSLMEVILKNLVEVPQEMEAPVNDPKYLQDQAGSH